MTVTSGPQSYAKRRRRAPGRPGELRAGDLRARDDHGSGHHRRDVVVELAPLGELEGVADAALGDGPGDVLLALVVGGEREGPVAELAMELGEVGDGGIGLAAGSGSGGRGRARTTSGSTSART